MVYGSFCSYTANGLAMIASVNVRSLDEKPVIKVLAVSTTTKGITLLLETPVPQTWTEHSYIWSWEHKIRHRITAATEQEALDLACQKIQWINQWEYRKATETFQD